MKMLNCKGTHQSCMYDWVSQINKSTGILFFEKTITEDNHPELQLQQDGIFIQFEHILREHFQPGGLEEDQLTLGHSVYLILYPWTTLLDNRCGHVAKGVFRTTFKLLGGHVEI